MLVLVDFVKFLLSFRNQNTASFKNTKTFFYFIGTLREKFFARATLPRENTKMHLFVSVMSTCPPK